MGIEQTARFPSHQSLAPGRFADPEVPIAAVDLHAQSRWNDRIGDLNPNPEGGHACFSTLNSDDLLMAQLKRVVDGIFGGGPESVAVLIVPPPVDVPSPKIAGRVGPVLSGSICRSSAHSPATETRSAVPAAPP